MYSDASGMFDEDRPDRLWMEHWSETHDTYLTRMGFAPVARGDAEVFELPMGTRF